VTRKSSLFIIGAAPLAHPAAPAHLSPVSFARDRAIVQKQVKNEFFPKAFRIASDIRYLCSSHKNQREHYVAIMRRGSLSTRPTGSAFVFFHNTRKAFDNMCRESRSRYLYVDVIKEAYGEEVYLAALDQLRFCGNWPQTMRIPQQAVKATDTS
jgi:hypothetical protein